MDTYTTHTQQITVDKDNPQPERIAQAAAIIQRGGLVAFPTETVYGLGANALDAQAIRRIYSAKQRPASDPVIAHIAHVNELQRLAVEIPDAAYQLAEAFWPGPLTLVLVRGSHVPPEIATGLATVAVRMPSHPVAHALIAAAGVPIAAPSANTFTRPSATTAAHVLEDLNNHVDIVLDGGAATIGIESTVIDMTQDNPVILRPGGLTVDRLREVLPEIVQMDSSKLSQLDNEPSSSPGMMIKHYSPRAEVILFDGGDTRRVLAAMRQTAHELADAHKRVGILTTNEEADQFTDTGARIISMGSRRNYEQIAHVLFGAMRALDNQKVDKILVRAYERDGLGLAIWDRLLRSAEGRVRHVE